MKAIKQLFHVIILLNTLKGGVIITPLQSEREREGIILINQVDYIYTLI